MWAIMPAAGAGRRFGAELPKQHVRIFGRSVLEHSLRAIAQSPAVSGIVLVLSAADLERAIATPVGLPMIRCTGGVERADSVLAGLAALPDKVRKQDWVLVHDAARPCLRKTDLERLIDLGCNHDVGALLATPVTDTLKRANGAGEVKSTVARAGLWRALTPQLFRRGLLTEALAAAQSSGSEITDEASAIERLGLAPLIIEGAADNLKITTAADLRLAAAILPHLDGPAA